MITGRILQRNRVQNQRGEKDGEKADRGRDMRTQREEGFVLSLTVADNSDKTETCTAPVL